MLVILCLFFVVMIVVRIFVVVVFVIMVFIIVVVVFVIVVFIIMVVVMVVLILFLHTFHYFFRLYIFTQGFKKIYHLHLIIFALFKRIINPAVRLTAYIYKEVTVCNLCNVLSSRLVAMKVNTLI